MLLQDLPHEVFTLIFQHLERDQVQHLLFLCKSVSPTAAQEYYKELLVGDQSIQIVQNLGDRHCLDYLLNVGWCVQKITLATVGTGNEAAFASLFGYLPNLRVIVLAEPMRQRFLTFAQVLQQAAASGQLQRVSKIIVKSSYSSIPDMSVYLNLCYQLRHNITHLDVAHPVRMVTINGKNVEFFNVLADFPNLTSLELFNSLQQKCDQVWGSEMFSALTICPQLLESYTFHSYLTLPIDIIDKYFEENPSKFTLRTHLQYLSVSITGNLSKSYLKYMYLFLPSITTLKLEAKQMDCSLEAFMQGNKYRRTIQSWATYASKIPNMKLDLSSERLVETSSIDHLWRFINMIIGNRYLDLGLTINHHSMDNQDTTFKIQVKDSRTMFIHFHIPVDDHILESHNDIARLFAPPAGLLPNNTTAIIRSVKIDNRFISSTMDTKTLLKSIINEFPHLNRFQVKEHEEEKLEITCSSQDLDSNEETPQLTSAQRNMDQLVLSHHLLGLLTEVNSCFPHIQKVTLLKSSSNYDVDWTRTTVDLRYMQNVKELKMEIDKYMQSITRDEFFILIECDDGAWYGYRSKKIDFYEARYPRVMTLVDIILKPMDRMYLDLNFQNESTIRILLRTMQDISIQVQTDDIKFVILNPSGRPGDDLIGQVNDESLTRTAEEQDSMEDF